MRFRIQQVAGAVPGLQEWNTLVEEKWRRKRHPPCTGAVSQRTLAKPVKLEEVSIEEQDRISTGYPELDRVLGSGIVAGSLVLVGGDPVLESPPCCFRCAGICPGRTPGSYISGEESLKQIKMRANRIGTISGELLFLCETNLILLRRLSAKQSRRLSSLIPFRPCSGKM